MCRVVSCFVVSRPDFQVHLCVHSGDVSLDVVLFFSDSLAGYDFAVTWKVYRRWSCHQQACGLKRHVAISWYHGYMHRMSLYRRFYFSSSKGFRHHQRFFQNPKSPGIILPKPAVWGSVVHSIMES